MLYQLSQPGYSEVLQDQNTFGTMSEIPSHHQNPLDTQAIIPSFLEFRRGHITGLWNGGRHNGCHTHTWPINLFTSDALPHLPFLLIRIEMIHQMTLRAALPPHSLLKKASERTTRWQKSNCLSPWWRKNHLPMYIYIRLWYKQEMHA